LPAVLGNLQRSPDPQLVLRGLVLRGVRGEEGKRGKLKGNGREGKGAESVPLALILQFDHC